MACGCEVYSSFLMWNITQISLPFVPRECLLLQRGTSSGGMSKIHVKCQSQTVPWIQLGVVEGDSHLGQSGF